MLIQNHVIFIQTNTYPYQNAHPYPYTSSCTSSSRHGPSTTIRSAPSRYMPVPSILRPLYADNTTRNIYIINEIEELLYVINSVFINAMLCPCYDRLLTYGSILFVCYDRSFYYNTNPML